MTNSTEQPTQSVYGSSILDPSTWYHVAAVYDGALKVYLNGQLDGTSYYWETISYAPVIYGQPDPSTLYIGVSYSYDWMGSADYRNPFSGLIDEVRFYNRALTGGQIAQHYNGVFAKRTPMDTSKALSTDPLLSAPTDFELLQNYPNPFNPETTIPFQLPVESHVILTIFDLLGRAIRTIIQSELGTGAHTLTWDGRNNNGEPVGSGIYVYRLTASPRNGTSEKGYVAVRKAILAR